MQSTKREQGLIAHLERYLGRIEAGGAVGAGVQIARFSGPAIKDTIAYSTLGLSSHLLQSSKRQSIREELVILARTGSQMQKSGAGILRDIADEAVNSHRGHLRGEIIQRAGVLLEGTAFVALYISAPAYLPDGFEQYSIGGASGVVLWLVPITRREAGIVENRGWRAFEEMLVNVDPDLLSESREELAE